MLTADMNTDEIWHLSANALYTNKGKLNMAVLLCWNLSQAWLAHAYVGGREGGREGENNLY